MITNLSSNYRIISDHSFAAVRQNIDNNQKAFFAQQFYSPGDVVIEFSASQILTTPSYLTVQVDIDKHIMLHPEHLQYINHSCGPNVFFDTDTMQIVALKHIAEGDEMTFFYPSTEWDMAQPFTCFCGTQNCLGKIQGAAHLSPEILSSYKLTRFIQQQLHDRSNKEKRA
ncbi:MAG: SET domain-containing protein-lysine N-methyltransferase [Chitinophagaceae bacterium]